MKKIQARLKRLNHAAVARHAGVTRSYITAICSGRRKPTKPDVIAKITRAIEKTEADYGV